MVESTSKRLILIGFLASLFIFPEMAWSKLQLKISMTHKLGIDNNLVLKSELHSIEEFFGSEKIKVQMRNGFHLRLSATYLEKNQQASYGPIDVIQIKGELYGPSGKQIKELKGEEAKVVLWKSKQFVYKDESGQQIEVTIIPEPS